MSYKNDRRGNKNIHEKNDLDDDDDYGIFPIENQISTSKDFNILRQLG